MHPLHPRFPNLKVGYFLHFVSDSTESDEAKVQMSFWADTKKSPGRPAIKDTEEVIKQVLRVAK
jgi:hypothetical protein